MTTAYIGQGPTHGKVATYSRGCRCHACRDAKHDYDRAWRAARLGLTPPKHGSVGYSKYNCRCQICAAAHAVTNRFYNIRKAYQRGSHD